LKARLGVNGSQNASRSFVCRAARLPISRMVVSLCLAERDSDARTRLYQCTAE
jgi:hypothetical protein